MRTPTSIEIEAFYRAGASGLRLLDAREGRGRRFGDAANAAWRALGGEFEDRDRLDLLLRDGVAHQPLAFSPRLVFQMTWLADDEPFGPEWPQAPAALAGSLLRNGTSSVTDATGLLTAGAESWGTGRPNSTPALDDQVARVGPASRVLVAGASAIFTLVQYAQGRRDLDLADQVLVLASSPAERHLWGLGLLALGNRGSARVIAPADAPVPAVRELGVVRLDVTLVSEDASVETREAAAVLTRELRA